jgi:hypothetical protein
MMMEQLTLHHYSVDPKEERRVTLSPMNIQLVAAEVEDVVINGRSVRNVTILFSEGGNVDLTINHADLMQLERAVGSFFLGEV